MDRRDYFTMEFIKLVWPDYIAAMVDNLTDKSPQDIIEEAVEAADNVIKQLGRTDEPA